MVLQAIEREMAQIVTVMLAGWYNVGTTRTLLCIFMTDNPLWAKAQYDTVALILLQFFMGPLQYNRAQGSCSYSSFYNTGLYNKMQVVVPLCYTRKNIFRDGPYL